MSKIKDETFAEVSAHNYRAAALCTGANDIRPYIRGLLCSKTGELVGSNGHMMFVAKVDNNKLDGDLIFLPTKIPAKTERVRLQIACVFDKSYVMISAVDKFGQNISHHLCPIIDGKYPDYQKAMDDTFSAKRPFNQFGFNPNYLAMLKQIFPKVGKNAPAITFTMHSNSGAVITDTNNPTSSKLYLMGLSLSDKGE